MAAADIEGVGEQLVRRLWALGLVRSIPALYRLTKEQLLELDGFQERSATNAVESIEASKATPFHRVLFGLNIPDVGWVTAQNLARHFGTVDALAAATAGGDPGGRGHRARARDRDRRVVRGRGERQADRRSSASSACGWRPGEELKPVEGGLTGNTYVITGTLERWTREQAASELEARGREGRRLGLEEDERRGRRRGAGRHEAQQGTRARRADPGRGRRSRSCSRRIRRPAPPSESLGPPTRFGR